MFWSTGWRWWYTFVSFCCSCFNFFFHFLRLSSVAAERRNVVIFNILGLFFYIILAIIIFDGATTGGWVNHDVVERVRMCLPASSVIMYIYCLFICQKENERKQSFSVEWFVASDWTRFSETSSLFLWHSLYGSAVVHLQLFVCSFALCANSFPFLLFALQFIVFA